MNNVSLIGRITADPEIRYLSNADSTAVANFTLAINRNYSKDVKEQMGQQGKPTADFIRCVAWGRSAELINQYVHKGDQLGVTGRIETGQYQHQDGHTVFTTDIRVESFDFINSGSQPNEQSVPQKPQQHGIDGLEAYSSDDEIPF